MIFTGLLVNYEDKMVSGCFLAFLLRHSGGMREFSKATSEARRLTEQTDPGD